MNHRSTLYFFCGKMAAGKSTLAKQVAEENHAVLLVEDQLLAQLYPEEINDIQDYVKYSRRLRGAIAPHVTDLLLKGISVVLDFPANTMQQRRWFREVFEAAEANHVLYFIDATNDRCKRQLKQRSQGQANASKFDHEQVFEEITRYFQPPAADEQFNLITEQRH